MKYHVPQYLDEPLRIVLWTVDEWVVFILPLAVCYAVFNGLLTGVLLGFMLVFLLRKLKGECGSYSLMYWYLPTMIRFKAIPPSCYREWIG